MKSPWRPFASYNLWSLFSPAAGHEAFHCSMKRGFSKARNKEPEVSALLSQNSIPQEIGLLAQQGIYEFHADQELLESRKGMDEVANRIQLDQKVPEVSDRVLQILNNYQESPVLSGKEVLHIIRGDEGPPVAILLSQGGYEFNLFAAFDCVFRDPDGTIHILDFKTGKSGFDKRQAYVYLLAAQSLYPNEKAVASFYNVESKSWSETITATKPQLEAIEIELMRVAQQHQRDLSDHRRRPQDFSYIFAPSTGYSCRFCAFSSVCDFSL